MVQTINSNLNKGLDVTPFISKFTFESICGTAMGLSLDAMDVNTVEDYHKVIIDIGDVILERFLHPWMFIQFFYAFTPTYKRERRVIKFLHSLSRQVISLRKKGFEDFMNQEGSTFSEYSARKTLSMLDILLLTQKEDKSIDDEEIREEVDTFMIGGHDTTMVSLTFTLMLLANHKEHQDRIYEELISIVGDKEQEYNMHRLNELSFMEMCIKESLRLYPSVPMVGRIVYNDVKLRSGKVIPAGTECMVDFWNIHRDPSVYPNPETYDPDRFLPENVKGRNAYAYLHFSAGPRNCIGQKTGMLELKCALAHILQNFILEPVDAPDSLEILWDSVIRTSRPIRVKFVERK